MMKTTWKEKQTNENVLQSVEEKRSLVSIIRKKMVRSYYEGRRTSKKFYRGKAEGKRSRERRCIMMLEEFMKGTTFDKLNEEFKKEMSGEVGRHEPVS